MKALRWIVIFVVLWALISLALWLIDSRGTAAAAVGGPYYFEGAEAGNAGAVPLKPRGRISELDAKNRPVYGSAWYDDAGRLTSYEAVKDGARVWRSMLTYHSSGAVDREVYTGPKGGVIVSRWNTDGRFIESRMVKAPD